MSLVEVLVAMLIMSIVIIVVDTSVGVLNSKSNTLSQSDQAIDQLQVAEQTVVRDVHAATSWCSPPVGVTPSTPCTAFTQTPTSSELKFNAVLDSSTWSSPTSFDIKLNTMSDGSEQLAITKNSTTTVLASNLDPINTKFTWNSVPVTTGGQQWTYYNYIGITLTMDSPRYGAPQVTKTTTADQQVEVWNVEYACTAAKGSGATPC